MIGGIGKVLGFEAQAGVLGVGFPGLAAGGAVEVIAAVELDGGLGSKDFEDAAGYGIEECGCGFEVAGGVVEDEVVIVAFG